MRIGVSFLLIISSALLNGGEIISEFEYGQMLYNNPRGVSCMPCHGLKGEGSEIVKYKDRGREISLLAPDIRKRDFEAFKRATSKGPKVMPKYFLTDEELQAIYKYIKVANSSKSEKDINDEKEDDDEVESEILESNISSNITIDVTNSKSSESNETVNSSSIELSK